MNYLESITIRQATPQDIDTIHQLGKSVNEFSVNKETVNFWPKDLLTQAAQSNDAVILIAEDETIVGLLIINYNYSLRKALIENIYVYPAKRGQGIGDKLLEAALASLSELGCKYVATLVPPDAQGALEFYQRNGFSKGETFVWLDVALDNNFRG